MQMKRYSFLLVAVLPFFFATGFLKKEKQATSYSDNWSGIISYSHIIVDKGVRKEDKITSTWDDRQSIFITVNVTGNRKGYASIQYDLKNSYKSEGVFGN